MVFQSISGNSRRAHNPEVAGLNPAPATNSISITYITFPPPCTSNPFFGRHQEVSMTNLKGIVSAFIATRKLRNLSPNTIEFYSKIFNKFLAFMQSNYPNVPIDQINHFMLREYILELKNHYSPGGVNHHIKALKILFKFMVGEEFISENPTKKISKLRHEQTVIPTFSNEQIKKMLEVTDGFCWSQKRCIDHAALRYRMSNF